ncbi:MAG: hypothetical protein DWP94_09280 [Flavobacterium sp.]|nr:MAG: hypothetical protein DWP94_09280 [Flavobacterium sp.]
MKNSFIIFLSLLIFGSTAIQAQHELSYQLKLGDSFKIAQKAIQNIKMTMEGEDHNMTNTLAGIFDFKVQEILEDSYVIQTSFKEFMFKTESDIFGVLNDVDTSRETDIDDMEANVFKGLIDVPFYITLRKDGKITSLEGVDALLDNMVQNAGIEDNFTKELIKEGVSSQFGPESLSESIEQLTYLFPTSKVAVADSWQNEYAGDLKAQNTWTLDSYNDSEYILSGAATVQMKTNDDSIVMELEGTQDSFAVIATENGFLRSLKVEQQTKGITTMNEMGGVKVDTTLDAIITYKRL